MRVVIGALAIGCLALAGMTFVHSRSASAADPLVICLDPGHSLLAGGASLDVKVGRGRTADVVTLREPDINLDVALEVARLLRADLAPGEAEVIMTWGEDWSQPWDWQQGPATDDQAAVTARGEFCSAHNAAIVGSLHTNALNAAFDGTLTGYRDGDDLALAETVHPLVYGALQNDPDGRAIRKFRDFGLDQGDWWISQGAPSAAVVVIEPVIMTDRGEARMLLTSIADGGARRAQIAQVEAQAIAVYARELLASQ